jgi:sulfide:quinone oxidoreductase
LRIVILGAGFGGLACANALRSQLAQDHSITVIDRRREFMMGLVNLWILHGERELKDAQTPLAGLNAKGIEYLNDEITAIDTGTKSVACKSHGKISYDYLVIALGSELAPERVSGFAGRGYNLYDAPQVPPLREKLLSLKKGRIAVCIMGMPYKCPPAPYEASLLIHDMLEKEAGSRKEVEIDVYCPAPIALPVAGPEVSREVVAMLESHNIGFHPGHKLKTVSDRLEFENGAIQNYDVLVGIPQHRVPDVIKSSGLAPAGDSGWMAVDRKTLRTAHENVFAIGDVTEIKVGQLAIPKAGIFAEAQAKAVAGQIADEINKEAPPSSATFDGKGFCFMETGNGQAGYVAADFFAEPGPALRLEPPSKQNYEKKHDFERSRLREWLL